jgi:PhnB protein
MHVPPGFATVFPYLVVEDAESYVRFLVQALNGEELGRSNRPDGKIANSQVRLGSTNIMVSEAQEDYPADRASLYLYVEDADRAMAQALRHGATLKSEVGNRFYDDRQGGIVDPSGNIWWISQRLVDKPYY